MSAPNVAMDTTLGMIQDQSPLYHTNQKTDGMVPEMRRAVLTEVLPPDITADTLATETAQAPTTTAATRALALLDDLAMTATIATAMTVTVTATTTAVLIPAIVTATATATTTATEITSRAVAALTLVVTTVPVVADVTVPQGLPTITRTTPLSLSSSYLGHAARDSSLASFSSAARSAVHLLSWIVTASIPRALVLLSLSAR